MIYFSDPVASFSIITITESTLHHVFYGAWEVFRMRTSQRLHQITTFRNGCIHINFEEALEGIVSINWQVINLKEKNKITSKDVTI